MLVSRAIVSGLEEINGDEQMCGGQGWVRDDSLTSSGDAGPAATMMPSGLSSYVHGGSVKSALVKPNKYASVTNLLILAVQNGKEQSRWDRRVIATLLALT